MSMCMCVRASMCMFTCMHGYVYLHVCYVCECV